MGTYLWGLQMGGCLSWVGILALGPNYIIRLKVSGVGRVL